MIDALPTLFVAWAAFAACFAVLQLLEAMSQQSEDLSVRPTTYVYMCRDM